MYQSNPVTRFRRYSGIVTQMLLVASDGGDGCPAEFVMKPTGCYLVVSAHASWEAAQVYCQSLGDHVDLVEPQTQQVKPQISQNLES